MTTTIAFFIESCNGFERGPGARDRMSPEERAAQKQYGDPENRDPLSPQLVRYGKTDIGSPYVKINPNWFNPTRPRSDIQLIIVKCWYGGMIIPGQSHQSVAQRPT